MTADIFMNSNAAIQKIIADHIYGKIGDYLGLPSANFEIKLVKILKSKFPRLFVYAVISKDSSRHIAKKICAKELNADELKIIKIRKEQYFNNLEKVRLYIQASDNSDFTIPKAYGMAGDFPYYLYEYMEGEGFEVRLKTLNYTREAVDSNKVMLQKCIDLALLINKYPDIDTILGPATTSTRQFINRLKNYITTGKFSFLKKDISRKIMAYLESLNYLDNEEGELNMYLRDYQPKNIIVCNDGKICPIDLFFMPSPVFLGIAHFLESLVVICFRHTIIGKPKISEEYIKTILSRFYYLAEKEAYVFETLRFFLIWAFIWDIEFHSANKKISNYFFNTFCLKRIEDLVSGRLAGVELNFLINRSATICL
ncbi:MAG: hypothetical protein NTZ95_08575 [Candidatus Omnitrophica bacterium]|nr:hypothetical protein [Candidatus Omnitrophota bacterium]